MAAISRLCLHHYVTYYREDKKNPKKQRNIHFYLANDNSVATRRLHTYVFI